MTTDPHSVNQNADLISETGVEKTKYSWCIKDKTNKHDDFFNFTKLTYLRKHYFLDGGKNENSINKDK